MSAREELAAIQEREWKATEGPWAPWTDQDGAEHMHGLLMVGNADAVIPEGESWVEGVDVNPVAHTYTPEDREFIAHARTDVPRLVKALEAVLEDHKPRTRATHTGCRECGQLWPCNTLRAIEAALTKAGGAA